MTATEDLHTVVGVGERFHRFREVSGVVIIEAATAQLNARLAARGALRRPLGRFSARVRARGATLCAIGCPVQRAAACSNTT